MHEGEDMIGFTSGSYFALVAIDNICGNGFIIDWAENVPSSIKDIEAENNWIGETEFKAIECGLYIARLDICDTDSEWSVVFVDQNISGYEIVGFLNQFVCDFEKQIFT